MAKPFGLIEALSVAVVAVTGEAGNVFTVGGSVVVKVNTAPNESPTEFCAIAQ